MTPDAFQSVAEGYIAAATVVVGLLCAAVIKLLPAIAAVKEAIQTLKDQQAVHTGQIHAIALATPPPDSLAPATAGPAATPKL